MIAQKESRPIIPNDVPPTSAVEITTIAIKRRHDENQIAGTNLDFPKNKKTKIRKCTKTVIPRKNPKKCAPETNNSSKYVKINEPVMSTRRSRT